MAFAAMFIATIFIIVILIGFGMMLVGIILDIIWAVRKHQQKKVHVVHMVFAVILTVAGFLVGVGPIALVGAMTVADKMEKQAEISDLSDDEMVHIKDVDDIAEGMDFQGVHYVRIEAISPQTSHENFTKEKIGAFICGNGEHFLLYRIENTMGIEILYVEYFFHGIFVEEENADRLLEYYENEAPLYCQTMVDGSDSYINTRNFDSDRVRQIRDMIAESGNPYHSSDYKVDEKRPEGYMLFYSLDDMDCFSMEFYYSHDGMIVTYAGRGMPVSDEDAEFIRQFVGG